MLSNCIFSMYKIYEILKWCCCRSTYLLFSAFCNSPGEGELVICSSLSCSSHKKTKVVQISELAASYNINMVFI